MKRFFLLLFLTITTVLFFSCSSETDKSSPTENKYYNSSDNISLLKEEAIKYLDEVVEDGSPIVFNANTPDDALPKIGTIFILPQSEKSPYGFMGRVSRIDKGSQIKIITEPVALDEAFKTISIDKELDLKDCFEGVYDNDGNPIEYQVVDSIFQIPDTLNANKSCRTGEFYLENKVVSFPIKLYKGSGAKADISVTGTAYVGFDKAKLDIEGQNFSLKYINFEAEPIAGIMLTNHVSTTKEAVISQRLGQLRFRPTFPIPVGPIIVPVVVPVTLYVYGEFGVKGEATATLTFKAKWNPTWKIELKNGNWTRPENHAGTMKAGSPWGIAGQFGVNGEIFSRPRLGGMVGLYTSTSGIGINFCPTYSLSANATLSSELLKVNPKVEQEVSLTSDIYCVAKVFGKKLAKLELDFPKLVLWSEKIYMLPQFENFEAYGNSTLGEMSYQIDQHYFLEGLGVKAGSCVFENDQKTIFNTYFPSPTHTANNGYKFYNVSVEGLKGGSTYYAAPMVQLPFDIPKVGKKLYGEKKAFTTETSYHAGFRCSGQSYDNIYFDFNIDENRSSTLDQTLETHDYSGELERIHFTAEYDASTKTLTGVIDYHFYENPGQRRQDGFTITLPVEDTGYLPCVKVIDNGACYKLVRIYRNNSRKAKSRIYNKPIGQTDCTEGDFNNEGI